MNDKIQLRGLFLVLVVSFGVLLNEHLMGFGPMKDLTPLKEINFATVLAGDFPLVNP